VIEVAVERAAVVAKHQAGGKGRSARLNPRAS
jgi:hypothetical protein